MKRFVAISLVFIIAECSQALATDNNSSQVNPERVHYENSGKSYQTQIQDSICGSGFFEMSLYSGPTCQLPPMEFRCFFAGDEFVIQRNTMPPYSVGQNVDIEVIRYTNIAVSNVTPVDTLHIDLSNIYTSTGTLTVDSVDSSGYLVGGLIDLDLYIDINYNDTLFLHNEDPLDITIEFYSMDFWELVFVSDLAIAESFLDSNQIPIWTHCSSYIEGHWCNCCSGRLGDVNFDGSYLPNILDLNYLVNYIFRFGPSAPCVWEADINLDGTPQNILDLNFLVNYLFRFGPAPGFCY